MEIKAQGLYKNFRHYQKKPGLLGSIQSIFHRRYEYKSAVSPFDLEVGKGEIVALLGPNGAGKTTLMKMMTGIIVPTGGELFVLGHRPFQREKSFRRKIALVMGQKSQLWWDIPAYDSFQLLQAYYEIPLHLFKDRVNDLAELLDVKHLLNIHVRKLSLGERMKMELMSCLLHRPQILFLDEPTIGLDVVSQKKVRQFLKEYHEMERPTIILTSHYMADVEALCQRLVLVIQGEKAFDGPLNEFEQILGKEKSVTFTFSRPIEMEEQDHFWKRLDAQWNKERTLVDLRIPLEELRPVSQQILEKFPVSDFATEKMPIERVLKTLLHDPHLLKSGKVQARPALVPLSVKEA